MEEQFFTEALREKLIIAGIGELETHGIEDFSLRRVASACGASCAAPYKHFKNKDDFILEIIKYINSKWELLYSQIMGAFQNDMPRCITEVCIASIRFRLTNPDFGIMFGIGQSVSREKEDICELVKKYKAAFSPVRLAETQALIMASVYGAVILISQPESDTELILGAVRKQIMSLLV